MLSSVRQRVRVAWSMWKYTVPAFSNAFLSVICYAIGWRLSTATSVTPLVHSGAAATAFSIGFAAYNYRKRLERSEQKARDLFARVAHGLPNTGAKSLDRIDEKLQGNTRRGVRVITIVQTIVLIVATVVWGFADLVSKGGVAHAAMVGATPSAMSHSSWSGLPDTVLAAMVTATITFVAAVIAAGIALLATTLTNRNARKQLKRQLEHDAEQRERERAMALRREVYLPATESLYRGVSALIQISNANIPLEQPLKVLSDVVGTSAKIYLLGDRATVRAIATYNALMLRAVNELAALRIPLEIGNQLEKSRQADLLKRLADIKRTTEEDKREGAKLMEEALKVIESGKKHVTAQAAAARRAAELEMEVSRLLPEALLALRRELGLPIDEGEFRELFARQAAEGASAVSDVFQQVERTLEKLFARYASGGAAPSGESKEKTP